MKKAKKRTNFINKRQISAQFFNSANPFGAEARKYYLERVNHSLGSGVRVTFSSSS